MDWSKAKSILIIALIVTNVLLGYVLFLDSNVVDATLKESFVQQTINILNEKDIKLSTDIPIKNESLYGLTVEYETLSSQTLNKNFFNNRGSVDLKSEGFIEIVHGDETITLVNNKLLIYESKSNDKIYNIQSEEQAIEVAHNFLNEKSISISDMNLTFIKNVNGIYNLEFTKVYVDNFLETTFTNIKLDNRGVIKLERTWLNTIETGERAIDISSAPKSLLALISMEEVYGKTIKDISLCYYFDPEKHDYLADPGEAQRGRTIPAWRIQFEDGYKVFIDNY